MELQLTAEGLIAEHDLTRHFVINNFRTCVYHVCKTTAELPALCLVSSGAASGVLLKAVVVIQRTSST